MNRGYSGYYKNYFLRSSYEYAYAKYLDYYCIPWDYEAEIIDVGYKLYKPDFFIYDEKGHLQKIVEVKSRNKNAKTEAKRALNSIEEKLNIYCELISYEELLELYRELPFSLTSTIHEWINSNETTISKSFVGKLNGHFNMTHSEKTKKLIGDHTKRLWESNSVAKQKMLEGLRNSGLAQKGKIRTPREKRKCIECGKSFIVLITSTKRYCSRECSGITAIKRATKSYMTKRNEIHRNIKKHIIFWSLNNMDIVLSTPYNKINSNLKPLLDEIKSLYGVQDSRVISKAVFGEDCGRKELLKFMKQVCNENVC
ncbi:PDDEXK family nuclease [Ornithinibacillus californiensis]|uniref:hypothetical protein n=1 Tax=Ornithinibacillus californiensis TaxID=161536 RepID=UPI00064DF63B|nr:hypothetical protein [Ornithinibacillus californiensis]